MLIFAFVIFSFLAINVFINNRIAQVGYNIEALKKEVSKLRNENRELKFFIATKENPYVIDQFASTKLKMRFPEKVVYIKSTDEIKSKN